MRNGSLIAALLLFGASVASAENVVKFGMVNDQSGPNKGAGIAMKVGVSAYFKEVNARGGVNGSRIELVTANDQYDPDKTVDGVLKLIEEQKIFGVVGTIGTSNGISILPIVKEQKIPFVSPRSGAINFRTPVIPEVFNIRASHQEEIDKVVDLLAKEGGAKRFAVFYQNDTFGTEILSCTENALKGTVSPSPPRAPSSAAPWRSPRHCRQSSPESPTPSSWGRSTPRGPNSPRRPARKG